MLRLSMLFFGCHEKKNPGPSLSVQMASGPNKAKQNAKMDPAKPKSTWNLYTLYTHNHAIAAMIGGWSPRPRHPAQLLLQVGNYWHLIDRRLDLQSRQVLTRAVAQCKLHFTNTFCGRGGRSKPLFPSQRSCQLVLQLQSPKCWRCILATRARKQYFESHDWPNHLVFLSWLIV
jgi:hypothetical protein